MTVKGISDMTRDELQALIERTVDQRMQMWLKPADTRSVKEIVESTKHLRKPPRPGTPSVVELLREDRDR